MADVLVGLDVGEARIGAAVGRVGSALVFGRGAIDARDTAAAVRRVRALVEAEGASGVVVGLPRRTDGRDSAQAARVRDFADALAAAGLAVAFEDERFTSRIATRQVRGSGLPRGKRQEKGRVDEASARLILESHLARIAEAGAPTEDRRDGADPAEPRGDAGGPATGSDEAGGS